MMARIIPARIPTTHTQTGQATLQMARQMVRIPMVRVMTIVATTTRLRRTDGVDVTLLALTKRKAQAI